MVAAAITINLTSPSFVFRLVGLGGLIYLICLICLICLIFWSIIFLICLIYLVGLISGESGLPDPSDLSDPSGLTGSSSLLGQPGQAAAWSISRANLGSLKSTASTIFCFPREECCRTDCNDPSSELYCRKARVRN